MCEQADGPYIAGIEDYFGDINCDYRGVLSNLGRMPRSSRSIRYDTYSLPACDSLLNLVNGMIMRDQLSGRILALAIRRSS